MHPPNKDQYEGTANINFKIKLKKCTPTLYDVLIQEINNHDYSLFQGFEMYELANKVFEQVIQNISKTGMYYMDGFYHNGAEKMASFKVKNLLTNTYPDTGQE